MNIKIDESYSIKSDLRNVMLVENKTIQDGEKKGEVYETTVGFYGTIEGALKGYLKIKTNLSDATTINELMSDIKNIEKIIEKVLKGN